MAEGNNLACVKPAATTFQERERCHQKQLSLMQDFQQADSALIFVCDDTIDLKLRTARHESESMRSSCSTCEKCTRLEFESQLVSSINAEWLQPMFFAIRGRHATPGGEQGTG